MSGKVEVRVENRVKILFVDLAKLSEQEIIATFPDVAETAIANNIRLVVLDISNTYLNEEIKIASKASIEKIESRIGKVVSALIGIRGIQKIVANAISGNQYYARNYNDAVQWITKQSVPAPG